jgi:RimJ/RimL family protein N-acetyltransferase
MIAKPTLTGAAVKLRVPELRDVAERLALGQTPEIVRMFGFDPAALAPLTRAVVEAWIEGLANHPHAWVIEHNGRFLGEIRLDALNARDRRAQLAIGLYDSCKLGAGHGREAIGLAMGHAFGFLELHRIGLRVVAYNIRAIRCYRACGFIEEGREREAAFVGGEWHDDVMMGLLAGEFEKRAAQYRAHS